MVGTIREICRVAMQKCWQRGWHLVNIEKGRDEAMTAAGPGLLRRHLEGRLGLRSAADRGAVVHISLGYTMHAITEGHIADGPCCASSSASSHLSPRFCTDRCRPSRSSRPWRRLPVAFVDRYL